jgi:ABC-type long-subunit fatty acid transport system fused permease/ATPase subunit
VEVGVAVNAWYAPFYDLIQTALSAPHKVRLTSSTMKSASSSALR